MYQVFFLKVFQILVDLMSKLKTELENNNILD